MTILKKEQVKVIGGKVGVSSKTNKEYANVDFKNSNGFTSNIFISEPNDSVKELVEGLDEQMGSEITLITSIEV